MLLTPEAVVHEAGIHARVEALIHTDPGGRAWIGGDFHLHPDLANQDPVFCCWTEHQQGYTGKTGQVFKVFLLFFFRPACIHPVSRQRLASLWDSLLLLQTGGAETGQMEQRQTNQAGACVHHVWLLTDGCSAAGRILKKMEKKAKEPLSNPGAAGCAAV